MEKEDLKCRIIQATALLTVLDKQTDINIENFKTLLDLLVPFMRANYGIEEQSPMGELLLQIIYENIPHDSSKSAVRLLKNDKDLRRLYKNLHDIIEGGVL